MKKNKNKSFDCVELKNSIQAKLLRQQKGMSDKKIRELSQKKLSSTKSLVGKKWIALRNRDVKDDSEKN